MLHSHSHLGSSPLPLVPLAFVLFFGKGLDIFILFAFGIHQNWQSVQRFLNSYVNPTIVIDSAKTATALFVLLQLVRYILGLKSSAYFSDDFPVKPMFFPCRTSHVRMFPTKHGFGYSYLLTGVPVGWKGSVGGMISEDDGKNHTPWYQRLLSLDPGGAWYTINGDDYLDRGHVEGGLQGKLNKYLEGQGIDPKQYAHAYLVTAARFLSYASNPLSVWYLYTSSRELSALILEVNNTFDERRIYFLKPNAQSSSGSNSDNSELLKPRYTGTWAKDFYVSVFNTRAGSYSLAAHDPFFPHLSSPGTINSTVTLSSPEGKAKLIARVYSVDDAIDPATMSVWQKTRFLASWWWVGLATFPRTIQQAVIILFRKKLPWVFRPEPRGSTIARHVDETELFVESLFRRYLRDLVENSDEKLRVRYIPAGLLDISEEVMSSSSAQLAGGEVDELEIRVLTPIFYSRVVRYPDFPDSIVSEHQESSTISISSTAQLSKLEWESQVRFPLDFWERLSFKVIHALRKRPAPIVCLDEPKTSPASANTIQNEKEVRRAVGSSLDVFVLKHSGVAERKEYTSRTLKLVITDHIAFGWAEILVLELFIVRSVALWIVARAVF
ncbi:Protein of unknown function (DUF1365) domain containing protein [Hyaloscypha variabilis]